MRARLVQMLRDDRADGIMPDLIRPDVVGMLFPFVPVRSRPEYEVAEVQARGPLAACVPFILGHKASSASCDSHATTGR